MSTNPNIRVIDARHMEPPEPFVATMEALDGLGPEGRVMLLLYREPAPLYKVLRQNGHRYEVSTAEDGTVQVLIFPV